jgi:hypothetical protein
MTAHALPVASAVSHPATSQGLVRPLRGASAVVACQRDEHFAPAFSWSGAETMALKISWTCSSNLTGLLCRIWGSHAGGCPVGLPRAEFQRTTRSYYFLIGIIYLSFVIFKADLPMVFLWILSSLCQISNLRLHNCFLLSTDMCFHMRSSSSGPQLHV